MQELQIGEIAMGLFGGLALFLFGMDQMTNSLKDVAGEGLGNALSKLTSNRFAAAGTGAAVTAIIQSSSVTTVLVVGFISAGIMSLSQSVGVIMGANIGTTITAQIIAFKVTHYALLLVAVGFLMLFTSKREDIRNYGGMVMGLGLIFFGMGIMSEATNPLRSYQPFIDLMGKMSNPFLGIAVAALFTALVQSSSATTGIVIVLASQGFITLEAGIALAFGANVGTCVTALLAAIGKPTAAKQASMVHLVFNIGGVLVWIPFIGLLASVVTSISPADPGLAGTAKLAAETPRQIANAHTIFNIANTLLFIGFTVPLAKLITRLVPDRPEPIPDIAKPRFLDDVYIQMPSMALDRIRLEVARFGEEVSALITDAPPVISGGSRSQLDELVQRESNLRLLYSAIGEYDRELSGEQLSDGESRRLAVLSNILNDLQHIGETISINFVAVGRERLEKKLTFSEQTTARFVPLRDTVRKSIDLVLGSMLEKDVDLARSVVAMKPEVQRLVNEIVEHLGDRFRTDEPNRAVLYRVESQAVELMQRTYYFAKKIGKEIIAEAQASAELSPNESEQAEEA